MSGYYAVAIGRAPGVYRTWPECQKQVNGYSGAIYKKFTSEAQALQFIQENNTSINMKADLQFIQENNTSIPITSSRSEKIMSIDPNRLEILSNPDRPTVENGKDDPCIIAFIDGACPNNGQEGAKASWGCVFPYHPEYNCSGLVPGEKQTNNRGEFLAFLEGYEMASKLKTTLPYPDCRSDRGVIIFYSDSKLLVDTINLWIPKWKKKGWRTTSGAVENLDLVKRIDKVTTEGIYKVRILHVPAHSKGNDFFSIWNNRADAAATSAVS